MTNSLKLITAIICLTITSCKQPEGKLSGVVTYTLLDKENLFKPKDMPDVGANIYVVKKSDFDPIKFRKIWATESIIVEYALMKSIQHSIEVANNLNQEVDAGRIVTQKINIEPTKKHLEDAWNSLKSQGINSEEDYKQFNTNTDQMLNEFKSLPNVKYLVANGTGSFSTNLEPGDYYIIFQSSGKKTPYGEGSFKTDNVRIESGKESSVNNKFGSTDDR